MEYRRYEDLEEDLKEEQQKRDNVVKAVSAVLSGEEFVEEKELNGVSFTKTYETNDTICHCQFYLDTEANEYSSYVTSEESGNKVTSFSQSGHIFDAEESVTDFVDFVRTL
jgi:hypothetical protein